jgi:hypothetical protein
MTIVGRSQIDNPALGTSGGSALHAAIETIYTNIGDHLGARYNTAASIANSAVTTFTHNFGIPFSDLKVLIYTGTHPNLVRVSDPAAAGWTIAATSGFVKTKIDVTAPASGGPHTFAVITIQTRGAEKLADLDDINTATPIDGQFLIYDTATSEWIPNYLKYKTESATIASNTLTPATGANIQRITSGAADLQMVASPLDGKVYVITNETGSSIQIKNDTGATAANRIYTGTGTDFTLKSQASVTLIYITGLSRWILSGGGGGGGLATSARTSSFTAAEGNHYLCSTAAGAFTATLPSGTSGAVLRFSDTARTWGTTALTIAPASGQIIGNLAANQTLVCDLSGAFVQLMWDGTRWVIDTNGSQAAIITGSLSSAQFSVQKNYIGNPNNATNWTANDGGVLVATESTIALLPANSTQTRGIRITRVSGTTSRARYRFTLDVADYNKKFQISFDQKYAGATGDYTLAAFSNTLADYTGTSTALTLQTSSVSALNGSFVTSVDMPGSAAPYIEFRIVAVAGTTPLYLNNVYCGPGVITQGAAVSEWQSYTPTFSAGFGSVSTINFWYRRVGSDIEIQGSFLTGTVAGSQANFTLPSGLTIGSTAVAVRSSFGEWYQQATPSAVGVYTNAGVVIATALAANTLGFDYQSAASTSVFTPRNGSSAFNSSVIVSLKCKVPIAEWAGSGTINLLSSTVTEANAGLSVEGLAAAAITINTAARFNTTKLLRGSITYSSATGGFTVPVSDFYSVRAQVFGPFNGTPRLVLRNTTDSIDLFSGTTGPTTLGPETGALIDCTVQLVTGKTYAIIVTGGSYTYYTGDVFNNLQVHRVPQYNTSAPVGFGKADSSNSGFVNPRKGQTTLIISGTGWSVTRAVGIYYQDQDGNHRLKFNIAGSCAATTAFTGTITGVTFFNVTSFGQAISATIGEAGIAARATLNAYVSPNAGTFFVSSVSGNFTFLTLSGDVELASKPSWA